jgi:hypothetical protein
MTIHHRFRSLLQLGFDANTPKRLEFYGLPVLPSPVRDALKLAVLAL